MKKKLAILVILILMIGAAFVITTPAEAGVKPTTVVYNIYATDGYIRLVDGTPLYIYGFVGGRKGEPITFMPSYDPISGIQPANVTLAGGAPDPTGGPVIGDELQLQGQAQFPAPVIYATSDDVVEIRLKNLGVYAQPTAPNDPHSIHLHGLDVDAANDGVPETSVGAVPANLCYDGVTSNDCSANGGSAPGAGNVVVYMFHQKQASTYLYHCHQEADIHVQMGMYGALVIYNPGDAARLTGPGRGQGGTIYGFKYDKDYIVMLSEFDVRQHTDEEGTYAPSVETFMDSGGDTITVPVGTDPMTWNVVEYKPQYWMINGLSFPNTIHLDVPGVFNYAQWIEAYPNYDALVTGSVSTTTNPSQQFWKTPGEKVLIRMINIGFETQPMHMHGFHFKILGSDQRAWKWANTITWGKPTPFGFGLEKNTITIGSGETYDIMVDFGQQASNAPQYAPNAADPSSGDFLTMWPGSTFGGVQTRYDPANGNAPVVNTDTGQPVIPDAGDPFNPVTYVGGPAVSQLIPFHNHDDYKATNNGVYPGGMFTMLVILP